MLLEAVVVARDRQYSPEPGQRRVTLAEDEAGLPRVSGSARVALAVRLGERRLLDAMRNFFGDLGGTGGGDRDSDGGEAGAFCEVVVADRNPGAETEAAAERPVKRQSAGFEAR